MRDPGLTITLNQVRSYSDPVVDPTPLQYLEGVGTFNAASPIEIRGAGGAIGQGALGVLGFNVPSLLGTRFHAPYFHNGAAQTLPQVFPRHSLGGGTIASTLNDTDEANLLAFLNALDGRTRIQTSDGDIFKDPNLDL